MPPKTGTVFHLITLRCCSMGVAVCSTSRR